MSIYQKGLKWSNSVLFMFCWFAALIWQGAVPNDAPLICIKVAHCEYKKVFHFCKTTYNNSSSRPSNFWDWIDKILPFCHVSDSEILIETSHSVSVVYILCVKMYFGDSAHHCVWPLDQHRLKTPHSSSELGTVLTLNCCILQCCKLCGNAVWKCSYSWVPHGG